MIITADTLTGKQTFTADDIQDMLDKPDMYYEADNLPKWLMLKLAHEAGEVEFKPAYQRALAQLRQILKDGKDVHLDVKNPYEEVNMETVKKTLETGSVRDALINKEKVKEGFFDDEKKAVDSIFSILQDLLDENKIEKRDVQNILDQVSEIVATQYGA